MSGILNRSAVTQCKSITFTGLDSSTSEVSRSLRVEGVRDSPFEVVHSGGYEILSLEQSKTAGITGDYPLLSSIQR